jgi:hypothetical protein
MTFTYRPAGRLEDVLPQALAYARKLRGGQGQREDAVFTLNKVNIVVTHNSSLDHIFAAFVDTPEGGTVGPCRFNIWRRLFRASEPQESRSWSPVEKVALRPIALHKLRVISTLRPR